MDTVNIFNLFDVTGDPFPPYNGKLRLYNMRYCPYAQRTMLALLAKNIDFEVINVNLIDKPEWLFQKSAGGKSIFIVGFLNIYCSIFINDLYFVTLNEYSLSVITNTA